MNNLFIMLAMLGFGASFWGAKAGSRPSSAASSSSRASAGSTASGGSTAPSESEQKILVSSEKSTKDKCFSSSQKLVEKGVFSFSGDIFVATDVSGNSFTKKSFLQFILEDVIKKNMNDPITCEMIASKDAGLELGGVGASGQGAKQLQSVLKSYLKSITIDNEFAKILEDNGVDTNIAINSDIKYEGDKNVITISFNPSASTDKLVISCPSSVKPAS